MNRRFGESPRANVNYKHRPGVYAILPRNGKLLLTFQSDPVPELQLPGGGVDAGESPLHALHREVREETGWKISNPRKIGTFRRFVYMPEYDLWAEKICSIYLALPVMCLGRPTEDGHFVKWKHPEVAIRQLGNCGDRHFVSLLSGCF